MDRIKDELERQLARPSLRVVGSGAVVGSSAEIFAEGDSLGIDAKSRYMDNDHQKRIAISLYCELLTSARLDIYPGAEILQQEVEALKKFYGERLKQFL